MSEVYADVIIEISHEKLDRSFQYSVPEELRDKLVIGSRVLIPFGNGNREIKGYCVGISDIPAIEPSRIKPLKAVLTAERSKEPEEQLVELAVWMKHHYGGTLIQSLKVVLPVKADIKQKEKRFIKLAVSLDEAKVFALECRQKHRAAMERLVLELIEFGETDYSLVRDKLNISMTTVRALENKGIIALDTKKLYRNPEGFEQGEVKHTLLTEDQQRIVDDFHKNLSMGLMQPCLLNGVTGSGKTEVYMEMIADVVKSGKQAIMLIPEIALTFQTVMRFMKRFGDRVSYLHSKLSAGERYDQFLRASRGEIDIMIGPRSALFTPFPRLGIIIIDEEHETSYKAENMPKYHARDVAIERARLAEAVVVMGSATPSVEASFRAMRGEYRLYELKKRISDNGLPMVYTVDMRAELEKGNRTIFSDKLYSLIEDRLQKKEQTILFINRRGMAGFVSCRKCGHVSKCPHCDVSLILHKNGKLVCHYCGYEEQFTHVCSECGSKYIGTMKAGTEQIEEAVKKSFPIAKVLRLDADTAKNKNDYSKILSSFSNGEADILVGTQMIVKGHDFPNVTLVGVLAADLSLYTNDYRAGERTFDLLTQAAGRAGRAEKSGEVVIQTYSPEHYAVAASAAQDYNKFYDEEIGFRKLCGYPPIEHMLKILIEDKNPDSAMKMGQILAGLGQKSSPEKIIGPAPDTLSKLKDVFRFTVYIKDSNYEKLVGIKDDCEQWRQSHPIGRTSVQFDFDP